MYVYVDESGDCGFKFAENSSKNFVVTALIVDDPLVLRGLIDGFKARYRISSRRELKFRSTPPEMRLEFLATICTSDFRFLAIVVDKTRLATQPDATTFYRAYVNMVVMHAADTIVNARLIIDESVKDKRWQGRVKAYLRHEVNSSKPGCLRDIKFTDAAREPVLQATDLLCGSVRLAVAGSDDRYLSIVTDRMIDLVMVPAQ